MTAMEPGHRRRAKLPHRLLAFGVAAPAVALASVGIAMAASPGFDNSRQYLSELGGMSAHLPAVFNVGVFAAGLMAAMAGVGFGLAVSTLAGARVAGGLTAIAFVVAGIGLVASALYPWPDPRHLAINLGLGIQLAPLLLLWGLRKRSDLPRLKLFLATVSLAMAVLMVITKHLVFRGMVNDANVGWWERAYAFVLVGWVGVAAVILRRRLQLEGSGAPRA
jgi:hypothetical membrane protein